MGGSSSAMLSDGAVGGADRTQLEIEVTNALGDAPELSTISRPFGRSGAISVGTIKDDTAEFRSKHPYLLALCFMLLGLAIGETIAYVASARLPQLRMTVSIATPSSRPTEIQDTSTLIPIGPQEGLGLGAQGQQERDGAAAREAKADEAETWAAAVAKDASARALRTLDKLSEVETARQKAEQALAAAQTAKEHEARVTLTIKQEASLMVEAAEQAAAEKERAAEEKVQQISQESKDLEAKLTAPLQQHAQEPNTEAAASTIFTEGFWVAPGRAV